jgi:hypothetical protein
MEWHRSSAELPASFARLGAKCTQVTPENVRIGLNADGIPENARPARYRGEPDPAAHPPLTQRR